MIPTVIAKEMYGQELIVRAFQHFATSTKSHKQLRIYYQIQSIKILTRITSKVLTSNEDEMNVKKICYIRVVLLLVERLMILNPLQKMY